MNSMLLKYRRLLVVFLHMALVVVASYTAFLLRFDGVIPSSYMRVYLQALPCSS